MSGVFKDLNSYYDLGGTIRTQLPQKTLEWLNPYLNDFGITRVANVTGLDCLGVPVALSIRPNARHLALSQGKGLTWELAKISAIMESIEGYHAENPINPSLKGSYKNLINHYPVINPRHFNSGNFTLSSIEDWSFDWIEAKNLRTNEMVFLPHILICLDSTKLHPEYSFLSVTSNGLAAGNTLEEAILHAIYEIIERDCLCQWANLAEEDRLLTLLNLDTVDSVINNKLIKQFEKNEQQLKIWDITSELGIPAFQCAIKDGNPLRGLGLFKGSGAHINKEVALSRALTEAAQARLTLISGSRDDVFWEYYKHRAVFGSSKTEISGTRNYKKIIAPLIQENVSHNLSDLLQKLADKNFNDIFLVNHTKPEFNIPVVHIFIPGMRFNGKRI